ncbi:unnamed protein product [Medioppia subpectinata]|uniref:Uncharacterized protein n=1 Tax=Medioppia subpectinata TaxID=1979941 RepID=A0A7R9Q0V3_9ACAR|nr:unnamed protein product [Medioppia subpectinata]CAG2108529.1 unnamed protein product [Medioppia subpectinata]
MNRNDNISDSTGIRDDMTANNALNNENPIIDVNEDNNNRPKSHSNNLILRRFLDNNCVDECNAIVKKSSDRNAINFMVLGYFLLLVIVVYAYFGTLISDIFFSGNNASDVYIETKNHTIIRDGSDSAPIRSTQSAINSDDDSTGNEGKEKKFIKTITSTEIIVILWLTLVYGSGLLLFLRFKVLKLERDPNSEKHKKKDSQEELNAFLANSRKHDKNSFKKKSLANDNRPPTGSEHTSEPFWHK